VGRVRADLVVVLAPTHDDGPSLVEAGEVLLVQAFVPEPPVEVSREGVLDRLDCRNVVPLDPRCGWSTRARAREAGWVPLSETIISPGWPPGSAARSSSLATKLIVHEHCNRTSQQGQARAWLAFALRGPIDLQQNFFRVLAEMPTLFSG
jgi:hypothetical protein